MCREAPVSIDEAVDGWDHPVACTWDSNCNHGQYEWEFMECGRGPDGASLAESDRCPEASDPSGDGSNGGGIDREIAGTFQGQRVRAIPAGVIFARQE